MKHCPNCHSEVEENFELCWKCNYSFTENKIAAIAELSRGTRELTCLRCKTPMLYSGNFKFHEGARMGVLGNLFELFVNQETFDLYICPKCGKVEFFTPQGNSEYKDISNS
jgi:Zn finger protein HypA/HybF involved in hydrogenase expression